MAQSATMEIPKAEAPDKQTYCKIKDGYLELRVKLQSGQTSRSGKSEVLPGNLIIEIQYSIDGGVNWLPSTPITITG